MAELFSEPDVDILSESSGTVHLCNPCECVVVLPITLIHSVVAMFPDVSLNLYGQTSETGKFSLMRHPYLEVAQFTRDLSFEDKEEEPESDANDN